MNTIDIYGDSETIKMYFEGTLSEYEDDSIISNMKTGVFAQCSNLRRINFRNLREIVDYAFAGCTNLSDVYIPNCLTIAKCAFRGDTSLEYIEGSNVMSIDCYAFYNCSNLLHVSFPMCQYINAGAFYSTGLVEASFPECTELYKISVLHFNGGIFQNCSNLISASFPKLERITSIGGNDPGAFQSCINLKNVYMPKLQNAATKMFYNCYNMEFIELPRCSYVGSEIFANCSNLVSVSLPMCEDIRMGAFAKCKNMQEIALPVCSLIRGSTSSTSGAFYSCKKLQKVELSQCKIIQSNAFAYCSSLTSLYLNGVFANLLSSNAFIGTPIYSDYLGIYGSIYVPPSLYSAYIADSVWSYFRDRFVPPHEGIYMGSTYSLMYKEESGLPVGEIEISAFVTDGLTSCHAVVDNTSYATIKSENQDGNNFTFVVSAVSEGDTTITVSALNEQGQTVTAQCNLNVVLVEYYYEVQPVSGATYGFDLNSNNYYESKNKGKDNSYAICKLVFSGFADSIVLECINYAEGNYDYGLISNLDTMLNNSSSADTSGVFKNFKGQQSASPVSITIPIPDTGEHFVSIKFIKDSNQASGNDSLQFRVVEPV